jgi:hypothetical protein
MRKSTAWDIVRPFIIVAGGFLLLWSLTESNQELETPLAILLLLGVVILVRRW